MMYRLFFIALCLAAVSFSTAVPAEEPANTGLNLDEYKNIPKGMLIGGKAGTAASEDTKAPAEQPKMTYEVALALYKKGKYAEILPDLERLSALKQGNAQELLGIMHRMGQGVEKNPAKAFALLKAAAEDNRALAQHHIGVMSYAGEGTQADPVQAFAWLTIAMVHYPEGAEKARAATDRAAVEKRLNRRDKEIAQKIARDFLDTKGEAHLLPASP